MAPVPTPSALTTFITSLLARFPSSTPPPFTLHKRGELAPVDPSAGVTPFTSVPNKAIFAIFGLLGAGFVLTGIWFFFWAKNGGFYFHENDWDDYKSTVLRRKGPNGTTLSGATESTDLGGGSVVHNMTEKGQSVWGRMTNKNRKKGGKKNKKRYETESYYKDDDGTTAYLGSEGGSSLGSEMSEMKREKRRTQKEAASKKKSRFHRTAPTESSEATEALTVADPDEEIDIGVQQTIRAYRHEKPARVGGLNKPADGSTWDGSTEASASEILINHREPTPTNTPTKDRTRRERNDKYTGGGGNGGIRKVVSTSQPQHHTASSDFWTRGSSTATPSEADTERERIRAEAKKLQEKGRAASSAQGGSKRRDFSFQQGDDTSTVYTSTTVSTEEAEREARRERRERRRREGGGSRSPTKSPTKSASKLEVPGSYYEDSVSGSSVSGKSGETGTKSYHHPIPGLSGSGRERDVVRREDGADEYKEERRKRRAAREGGGGYRRGRDDLE